MPKVIDFWQSLADHPPVLVRILARRRTAGSHVEAISTEEVAITSDIPLSRVRELSTLLSWDNVTMGEAERFCRACAFDPTRPADLNRYRAYSYQCKKFPAKQWFQYLRRSPWWATEFVPLINLLRSRPKSLPRSRTEKAKPSPSLKS